MKYEKVGCNGDLFVVSLYAADGGLDSLRFHRDRGSPEVEVADGRFIVAVHAHSTDFAFQKAHALWKEWRV